MEKRIVCLANSRKHGLRCVAGREIVNGQPTQWVRPIGNRDGNGVTETEIRLDNGSDPRFGDIMFAGVLEPRPIDCHVENWLIDTAYDWRFDRRATWNALVGIAEAPPTLWINGDHTGGGLNDQIQFIRARDLTSSITMIRVPNVTLRVVQGYNKKKVQAVFRHLNVNYELTVTDLLITRAYLTNPYGDYEIGECLLTISLSEPFQGYLYKLVAAVIRERDFQ